MKKQWKKEKNPTKKRFSGQHHFTHLYDVYNNWKELEKLQESSGSFMEVTKAFISAEKLSDDEDVGETPSSRMTNVTRPMEQLPVRNRKEEKLLARNSKEQKLPARRHVQI
jgi:hypothetical protein